MKIGVTSRNDDDENGDDDDDGVDSENFDEVIYTHSASSFLKLTYIIMYTHNIVILLYRYILLPSLFLNVCFGLV